MPYFDELRKRLAMSLQDPRMAQVQPGSLATTPQMPPQATDLQALLAEKQAAQQDASLGNAREANMNGALQEQALQEILKKYANNK